MAGMHEDTEIDLTASHLRSTDLSIESKRVEDGKYSAAAHRKETQTYPSMQLTPSKVLKHQTSEDHNTERMMGRGIVAMR